MKANPVTLNDLVLGSHQIFGHSGWHVTYSKMYIGICFYKYRQGVSSRVANVVADQDDLYE